MSLGVDRSVRGVGEQAHDDVGLGHRVGGVEHAQPGLLGLGAARAEPGRSPTRTSNPVSCRFCACAWPCEPNPSTAIF